MSSEDSNGSDVAFDFDLDVAFAVIAPRITGSISAISSSAIIYIIARSKSKLGTIYHRLMVGMSIAGIFASVAMGLTTLPMPAQLAGYEAEFGDEFGDGGYESVYNYNHNDGSKWMGSRLGNDQTCAAQGFFFLLGTVSMFVYNASLCIYYTCAIAFKMEEGRIIAFVEPLLHLFPIVSGLVVAVVTLSQNVIHVNFYPFGGAAANDNVNANANASDANANGDQSVQSYLHLNLLSAYQAPWCTVATSPMEQDAEFVINFRARVELMSILLLGIGFGIIIASFVIIICNVMRMEKMLLPLSSLLRKNVNDHHDHHDNHDNQQQLKQTNSNDDEFHDHDHVHNDKRFSKNDTFRTAMSTIMKPNDDGELELVEAQSQPQSQSNGNRKSHEHGHGSGRGEMPNWKLYNKITNSHNNTKIVLVQAMAYICSFTITLICPFIRSIITNNSNDLHWLLRLQFVLLPLQGFFNAIIFISHKIYNYRRLNGDVSRWHVLKLLFTGGSEEPVLISRISLIKFDADARMFDVQLANEDLVGEGQHEHYNFPINGKGDGDGDGNKNGESYNYTATKNDEDDLEEFGFSLEGRELRQQQQLTERTCNKRPYVNANDNTNTNDNAHNANINQAAVTNKLSMKRTATAPRRSSLKSSLKSRTKKSGEEDNRNVNWSDNSNSVNYIDKKSRGDTGGKSGKSGKSGRLATPESLRNSQNSNPHSIEVVGVQKMTSFGSLSNLSPSLNPSQYEGPDNNDSGEDDDAGIEVHSKSKGIGRLFRPSMHLF